MRQTSLRSVSGAAKSHTLPSEITQSRQLQIQVKITDFDKVLHERRGSIFLSSEIHEAVSHATLSEDVFGVGRIDFQLLS